MKSLMTLLVLLTLQLPTAAGASEHCGQVQSDTEWSAQCFHGQGAERSVKPQYLGRLSWNRFGMATIVVESPRELLAVDRNGRVVIPNIRHSGDFDYPHAAHGIGRFEVKSNTGASKCGYFIAERFTVLVPPEYDQCLAYRDEEALACKDCEQYCTDQDCHDSVLVGGKGSVLARDGKVIREVAMPTLERACRSGKASLHPYGSVTVLRCTPPGESPFQF